MSENQNLSRGLKNRHVQLLAIGGAIGTGLFLGSGRSIHLAGPSILFAYMITGVACFFIMRALGELLLSNLNYHSFVDFVYDYLGERTAFITGWTYWFCWISLAMADLTAAGLYIQYWFPNIAQWVPSLIVLAILVGLTAGETENPEHVIPKAINNIPIRIIIFYVGALFVIMSIYPWNSINPDNSPFVQVFAAVGIAAAASIVNFVVLTSAASACNSGIFSTSRMVYSLAKENNAPESMKKLTSNQVPANATVLSAIVVLIAVIMQYIMPEGVFVLITSISTFCFIFIWAIIIVCHLRYHKTNPELAAKSKFKMPLYPIANYIILAFFAFVIVVLALNEETRVALFVTPVWFIMLGVIYKILKSKMKNEEDVESNLA
ncbi:MAG: D-serine/D-alanine/glycine transporter [Firmicutes bacterium]|nr:D-serine/D-alanine/glycine transporter [Bacillota bacterium]